MQQPLEVGTVIHGKYQVERTIGAGGMGVLFVARHLQLRERVAIKVLKPDRAGRPGVVERLLREARAAASIHSRHVVRVMDVGTLPDAQPFIVMEYLQGEDLATLLAREGALPVADAVDHLLEACEALAEAHALGIVHRDLKPANLFLERRASGAVTLKVLDFGVARFLAGHTTSPDANASLTGSNAFVGSPAYISPEQLTSPEQVDTRADIWALGVILYEVLAGAQPFKAPTLALTCTRILQEPPPPLQRAGVPTTVAQALERALQKDPRERCANVLEFATLLAPHGSERARASLAEIQAVAKRPPLTAELAAPPQPEELGSPTLTGSVLRAQSAAASLRARLVFSGLGVALIAAVLLRFVGRSSSTADHQAEPQTTSAALSPAHTASELPTTLAVTPLASGAPGAAAPPVSAPPLTGKLVTKPPHAPRPEPGAATLPPSASSPIPVAQPRDDSERLYEFRK